ISSVTEKRCDQFVTDMPAARLGICWRVDQRFRFSVLGSEDERVMVPGWSGASEVLGSIECAFGQCVDTNTVVCVIDDVIEFAPHGSPTWWGARDSEHRVEPAPPVPLGERRFTFGATGCGPRGRIDVIRDEQFHG